MRFRLIAILPVLAGLALWSAPAFAQSRTALVIGNSGYELVKALPNPANDAKAVAQLLNSAGFEVVMAIDLNRELMRQVLSDFSARVLEKGADSVALVYYAGHGLQVDGENFLVPVDARFEKESDVVEQAVRLADVMAALEAAPSKVRIVILDACRNNPFSSIGDVAGKGLAIVDAPTGSIVAYSTAPGAEALDGTGTHSPYAAAFMRMIKTPNLPIEQLFKKVRVLVNDTTSATQTPWESSSLTADFAFFSDAKASVDPVAVAPAKVAVAELRNRPVNTAYETVVEEDSIEYYEEFVRLYPTDPRCDHIRRALSRRVQMVAWQKATHANSRDDYAAFVSRFGNSEFANAAKRLQERPRLVALPFVPRGSGNNVGPFGGRPGPFGGAPSGQVSGRPSGPLVGTPSGPVAGRPGGSAVGTPSGPVVTTPSGSVVGKPSGPVVTTPSGSVVGKPAGPVVTTPSGSVVGKPAGPVVATPSGSVVGKPAGPVVATPSGSVVGKPAGPVVATPSGSVVGKPAGPVVATPSGSVVGKPAGPVVATPSGSVVGKPAGPVVATPSGSVVGKPAGPVVATPSGSVVGKPAGPVVATPSGSVVGKPAGPVVATPSGSVVGKPAGPVVATPSGSVVGKPAGPVVATPSGSVVGRPATSVIRPNIPVTATTVNPGSSASTKLPVNNSAVVRQTTIPASTNPVVQRVPSASTVVTAPVSTSRPVVRRPANQVNNNNAGNNSGQVNNSGAVRR